MVEEGNSSRLVVDGRGHVLVLGARVERLILKVTDDGEEAGNESGSELVLWVAAKLGIEICRPLVVAVVVAAAALVARVVAQ